MCFHIFSKDNVISIDYAVEDIKLNLNGDSLINIDFFISNHGGRGTEVKSFDILYPKSNYSIKNNKGREVPILHDFFKDITHTFIEKQNTVNFRYFAGNNNLENIANTTDNVYKFKFCPPEDQVTPFNTQGIEFTVKDVVHSKSLNVIEHCALLKRSKHQITLLMALEDINYSVLRYHIKTPILPDETRFFRFAIGPYKTAQHRNNKLKGFFLKLYNALYLPFEIVSPYDVLHRFARRIESVRTSSAHDFNVHEKATYELLNNYVESEIKPTKVEYVNWKIELHPDKFRLFHNILSFGNLKPLGVIPNDNLCLIDDYADYISEGRKYKKYFYQYLLTLLPYKVRSYDFITQNKYDENHFPLNTNGLNCLNYDDKYGFRLYFTTKYPTYTYKNFLFIIFGITIYFTLREAGLINQLADDLIGGSLKIASAIFLAFEAFVMFPHFIYILFEDKRNHKSLPTQRGNP